MAKKETNKKDLVAVIKEQFSNADSVIMVDYRGLTVKESQELRRELRDAGASMKVYKNTLTDIALRELSLPTMEDVLAGPTAFVFGTGEANVPAKIIAKFAKAHKALEIKGGLIENAAASADEVQTIASLPSREELLAKMLGTMKNPMANFARVIDAIAKQKSEEESAAA